MKIVAAKRLFVNIENRDITNIDAQIKGIISQASKAYLFENPPNPKIKYDIAKTA